MKKLFSLLVISTTFLLFSCNENSSGDAAKSDSTHTGLEGTREEASQLSNAPLDTSSGQTKQKETIDSSHIGKDSLPKG